MTSNYKFANSAYTVENYDLTHEQNHKLKDAIDNNYKNGGGFGYICIPKPNSDDNKSNFDVATKVECAPVFVSKDLIPRDANKKALNVQSYQGEEYLVLANDPTKANITKANITNFNDSLGLE